MPAAGGRALRARNGNRSLRERAGGAARGAGRRARERRWRGRCALSAAARREGPRERPPVSRASRHPRGGAWPRSSQPAIESRGSPTATAAATAAGGTAAMTVRAHSASPLHAGELVRSRSRWPGFGSTPAHAAAPAAAGRNVMRSARGYRQRHPAGL